MRIVRWFANPSLWAVGQVANRFGSYTILEKVTEWNWDGIVEVTNQTATQRPILRRPI